MDAETTGKNSEDVPPVSKASKKLPPEVPAKVSQRRQIILSFWVVVLLLGLPIWWKTTTVYRATLPLQLMADWAEGRVCKPVFPLQIDLMAPDLHVAEAQQLLKTTQHALDDLNDFPAHHLRLSLTGAFKDGEDNKDMNPETNAQEHPATEVAAVPALRVRLSTSSGALTPTSNMQPHSEMLDVRYAPNMLPQPSATSSVLGTYLAKELQNLFAEEKAILSQSIQGISNYLAPETQDALARQNTRSAQYSPIYHLSFSLLTPGASPSSWDVEEVLRKTVLPLTEALLPISNFTVDTQVQPYATFSTSVSPTYDEAKKFWVLRPEDLAGFINSAEWPLTPGIGDGSSINFILYVAEPSQAPLIINGTESNSWLVPQWGGVVLHNPSSGWLRMGSSDRLSASELQPAFLTFSSQFLSLLGVPSTPNVSFSLRLATLRRMRASSLLLSTASTLGSLARLVTRLPSISVPNSVADSVSSTFEHLDLACRGFKAGDFDAALLNARKGAYEVEKAFFDPSMVGQVYFPDEHKVAVYLPLLGPVAVPLLLSALKEILPTLRRRLRRQ